MKYSSAPLSAREVHLKTTRVHFDNVLVAVDMSAFSANTVRIAAELAQRSGSRLIVAHVLDPAVMLASETAANMKDTMGLWLKSSVRDQTRFTSVVVEGDVVDEINRLADEYRADLLVIGTHRPEGLVKLIFGSKAEALFRNIGIPVLTIGPQVLSVGDRFRSILLPTDLEPHSFRAAQYAVSLAEESDAIFTLLHILEKDAGLRSHQAVTPRMEQLVPEDAALWCKPVFRTTEGTPAETILAIAEEVKADLIVLGITHARPLADRATWSIASKIIHQAGCPVLTVRDHL
jgi:nucleotide-binding universal stress UspA family protein